MSLFGSIVGYIQSGRAAKSVSQANNDAMQGVLGATRGAVGGLQEAQGVSENEVNTAGTQARGSLQNYLGDIRGQLAPYLSAGGNAITRLSEHADTMQPFKFDSSMLDNDPGYQFQKEQGMQAIQGGASPTGLGLSGNTQKEMAKFTTGLAGQYYQQAFDRAKSAYDTNQNATLATLQSLIAPGLTASGQYSQATQNLGGQEAQTQTDLAKFLSMLRAGSAEQQGQFSMAGAKQAGDYRVGQGQATASGYMNQGAALSSGMGSIADLIRMIPGIG